MLNCSTTPLRQRGRGDLRRQAGANSCNRNMYIYIYIYIYIYSAARLERRAGAELRSGLPNASVTAIFVLDSETNKHTAKSRPP